MTEKDLALVPEKESVSVSVSARDPETKAVTDPAKDLETDETGSENDLLVVIRNGLEIAVESDPKNDLGIVSVSVSVLALPLVVVPAPVLVPVVALPVFSI